MPQETARNRSLYGHYQTFGEYLKKILVDPRLGYWFPKQTILNPKFFIQDYNDILQSKCLFEGACISVQEITQSSIVHANGFNHANATLNADIYPNSLAFYQEMSIVSRHVGSKKAFLGRRRVDVVCTRHLFLKKLIEICGRKIPIQYQRKLYNIYFRYVATSKSKYYNMFWDCSCIPANYKEIKDCGYNSDKFILQIYALTKFYGSYHFLVLKVLDRQYKNITDVKSGNPVIIDPEAGVKKELRTTKKPPRRIIFSFEEVFILFPFLCQLDMTECWDKMAELCEEGAIMKEYVNSFDFGEACERTQKQRK